jgi:hypothetical protein
VRTRAILLTSVALALAASSVLACDHQHHGHGLPVDPYSTVGASGSFLLDGPSLGHHQNDYSVLYYPCNGAKDEGAVRFELEVSKGDDPARRYAYVTLFPLDSSHGVDLKMPWMHTSYAVSDCKRFTANAHIAVNDQGVRSMHGTVAITCEDKAKNAISLDLSYDCATP